MKYTRVLGVLLAIVIVSCSKDDAAPENRAPEITNQAFNVSESIGDNEVFGIVKATDINKDDQLTFKIKTNDNALFEVSAKGELSLAKGKSLDFETQKDHSITVEVSDGSLQSSAHVSIKVTDIDENVAPVIDVQSFSIAEDAKSIEGKLWVLGTIVATDADTGDMLTFSITTNDNDLFGVTEQGELFLSVDKVLDYETNENHSITVQVSDGSLQASANIKINVTNVLETTVSTVAGSIPGYLDGTGTNARFRNPVGIVVDGSGNIYVADSENDRIRKITPSGVVTTLAGTSQSNIVDGTGTGAAFQFLFDLAIDASGDLYVGDTHSVRKITPSAVVTTFAGASTQGLVEGTGTDARFIFTRDIAIDASGNLFVVDEQNHRIRKITPSGVVSTFVGSAQGFSDGTGTSAKFDQPRGITIDGSGNLYVADAYNHRIRKITSSGVVSTIAGSIEGYEDGTGTAASFRYPNDVVVDNTGNLYVVDSNNHRIRKITSSGEVTTIAGAGTSGAADGDGISATFSYPQSIGMDASGRLYVADWGNHRIRKITIQ